MLAETVKYLLGSAGPSGFGSTSTAVDVTAAANHLGAITAIITGATSGIGFETARALAARGARLILPARNPDAAEEVKSRIAGGGQIIILPLDLGSLSSIRSFVSQFLALGFPLNILINNAGRFAYDQAESEDGIELTFAINFLGPFLLTKLLLEKMVVSARETGIEGRIVNVSSFCHRWFSGDPLAYLRLLAAGEV
ncbi:Short-chain dehydrogenase TIC 32, chloroplastic [Dendrobium catenatum]|uniref:Short-chain dehydrogenase TIC 32, chloroplastic n=2 Tax=Dendrobium catenatum TaxID=906689 RepID=A0A2I0X651_9ASPA|nr:Short-chain dehydrogenase TIC 32, chloroplastic [Dendrobium catenatum]